MPIAAYKLEVDWNNDGDYLDASEDVTAECLTDTGSDTFQIRTQRGRDTANELLGRAQAGMMEFYLDNTSRKYSPENSGSPLAGLLKPGRPVRLRTTAPSAATLFDGFLDDFKPEADIGRRLVYFRALDGMAKLRETKVKITARFNILTGTAITAILDAASWPASKRAIDAGQTTMPVWWADDVGALSAIREIEETELGFFYVRGDGYAVFEDRHHRLKADHLTVQATYGDAAADTVNPTDAFDYDGGIRNVRNKVEVILTPRTKQAGVEAWRLRETLEIGAGQSVERFASFPDPAEAIIAPVSSTDYTANSKSDGTGSDLTSSITIALTPFANSAKLAITNNASVSAFMTLLRVRADLWVAQEQIRLVAEDATSEADYGIRDYPLPGPFRTSSNEAKDHADFIVFRYKTPNPMVSLDLINADSTHLTEILARAVSDRVRVKHGELGLDGEFFVESLEHEIAENGGSHRLTLRLSKADPDKYWVLGDTTLGVLGSTTKVGY